MSQAFLLLVDTPKDPVWELDWESLHGVRTGLLSWLTDEPQPDGAIPRVIADLLARAFCRKSMVTYFCSQVPANADGAWRSTSAGAMCRIRATSIVQRQEFPLLATRKPEVAAQLFDDAGFSWALRSQMVLLSDPERTPPLVDWGILDGAAGRPLQVSAERLREAGVKVLVLPGMDGCVAGFYFLDEDFGSAFVDTLRHVCEEMQVPGEVLPEAGFKARVLNLK